ncbi:uncharacterized protein LOC131072923 isoform X1 [Cryptomeria japonica]|uniref:uncharacterized protein LOC131072923 isoform X1 n=2 Tax=Cryptomeria japonica TaxID=3369 RepID=UPI0027D9DED6|nr:uncharacterized protein LOC131072923 isoform X1 [Cryptomeria japonica]
MALKTQTSFTSLLPKASNSNRLVILHPLSRRVSCCKACFKINYVLSCMGNLKQKNSGRFGPPVCNLKHKLFLSLIASAAPEDGITVNGSSQANSDGELEEMRLKLSLSFKGEDASNDLVQSLHEAARIFELSVEQQSSLTQGPWFAKAWLGIDKNAWIKTLAYQASVHALLQAAIEIASRGHGRDRDVNVFVQRSLLRQSNSLENLIRDQLSSKDSVACEWFWSQQHSAVVTNYVNLLEKDPLFTSVTSVGWEGMSLNPSKASDVSLLMLALNCIASVIKLGLAKVSCPQFSSTLSDMTGKLMNTLASLIPIDQVYHFTTQVGLRREFLAYFGPRAATYRGQNDVGGEEGAFWVDLVQQQLRGAIDKERMWSKLTTYESIEVLERDLAIFGFFAALGRRTQSYLDASNIDNIDETFASFLRYLVGGSVLFYPQLASVSTYQFFVEVACEEMEWLPFYPESSATVGKQTNENRSEQLQSVSKLESITLALDVCSHWVQNFIKYSVWLEKPSNIKAAKFLSLSHSKLEECRNACYNSATVAMPKYEITKLIGDGNGSIGNSGEAFKIGTQIEDINLFDKELQNVDEALNKLEGLLKEMHLCSSNSDKEHLEAACTDLERIRKLKKEAEFLEASLRAKAASVQQEDKASDQTIPQLFKETETFPNEIQRFKQLRNELAELEKRVQQSANGYLDEKHQENQDTIYSARGARGKLAKGKKESNLLGKSIDKLKETGTDVWQGTQLLATDVAAASVLLRRTLTGDELTEKEKTILQRTLTDLASVIPIGILMLLPVTAVGHAAMLAAIKKYFPSMIPSAYARERLDLLRQLEKVQEMEVSASYPDEGSAETVNS